MMWNCLASGHSTPFRKFSLYSHGLVARTHIKVPIVVPCAPIANPSRVAYFWRSGPSSDQGVRAFLGCPVDRSCRNTDVIVRARGRSKLHPSICIVDVPAAIETFTNTLILPLPELISEIDMSTTLLKNSAMRSALRATAPSAMKRTAMASTSFVRGKATLPDLSCKQSR